MTDAAQSLAERAAEESWKESVRAYHREHEEARRFEWIAYHHQQAERWERLGSELAEKHREKAEALAGEGAA